MSVETRGQVIALAKLYEEEEERERKMESAKATYEGLQRSYDEIRNRVDVAELKLEGSQG